MKNNIETKRPKQSPNSKDLFACKIAKQLGFWIAIAGDFSILYWVSGGCRPANETELAMWAVLRYHFDSKTWCVPTKKVVEKFLQNGV